ncbi:MAG: hypothetical protein U5R48_07955, partial [Gammaproteobacteria bacterium]|nr:hypothetical protein [Gammaproteobacteria bacterium]
PPPCSRGEEADLEAFHDAIEDRLGPVFDWDDIRSSNDAIGGALGTRARSFLLLAVALAATPAWPWRSRPAATASASTIRWR